MKLSNSCLSTRGKVVLLLKRLVSASAAAALAYMWAGSTRPLGRRPEISENFHGLPCFDKSVVDSYIICKKSDGLVEFFSATIWCRNSQPK